jgi:hypothetical protein
MSTGTLHSYFILAMMGSDQLFALAIVTVGKILPVPVPNGNEGHRVGPRIGLEGLNTTKSSCYKSIHYSLSSSLWPNHYTNCAIPNKITFTKIR